MRTIGTVKIGWIHAGVDSGKIPDYDATGEENADAVLLVALEQNHVAQRPTGCTPLRARAVRLNAGDHLTFEGTLLVRLIGDDGTPSQVRPVLDDDGNRLDALVGPITLEIGPYPGVPASECSS
jgi:hypothetical protein